VERSEGAGTVVYTREPEGESPDEAMEMKSSGSINEPYPLELEKKGEECPNSRHRPRKVTIWPSRRNSVWIAGPTTAR